MSFLSFTSHTFNTNGKEKQLGEVKSSDSSKSAEKKNVVILGDGMIKYVDGYEVSNKLENYKVTIRSFSVFKGTCM